MLRSAAESFLVYILAAGKIADVLSHNKCAAGSGEFFVQQIGRMGLSLEEAIRLSFDGKVVPLARRCSVHCKSDITHKLNRNEATPEDILHTLHDSMADKVVALLEKGQRELRRVLLIGGMTRNAAMLAALRGKLPTMEFVVLPESPWFEAWGCALLTRDEPHHRSPQIRAQPALGSLPPLHRYAGRVQVIAAPPRQAPPTVRWCWAWTRDRPRPRRCCWIPRPAALWPRTTGAPTATPWRRRGECLRALAGAGRQPARRPGRRRPVRPANSSAPFSAPPTSTTRSPRTRRARRTSTPRWTRSSRSAARTPSTSYLRNGVPIDYAMNNACSAGTGSFLEESAPGRSRHRAWPTSPSVALAAPAPVQFKATCAAFINSDIRIAQQQGHSRDNIVAGLVYAIAGNYLTRVKGPAPWARRCSCKAAWP